MDVNGGRVKREQASSSPDRALLVGAVAGVVHGVVALYLWTLFGFESFRGMLSAEPLFLLYTVTGLFALGFVPGLLYAKWGSVSPGLLTGGLLCLSAYGTWTTVGDGATPVGPTPFGWYTLLWAGVAVLVSGVGWAETRRNR